jgi:hypothetical protein
VSVVFDFVVNWDNWWELRFLRYKAELPYEVAYLLVERGDPVSCA